MISYVSTKSESKVAVLYRVLKCIEMAFKEDSLCLEDHRSIFGHCLSFEAEDSFQRKKVCRPCSSSHFVASVCIICCISLYVGDVKLYIFVRAPVLNSADFKLLFNFFTSPLLKSATNLSVTTSGCAGLFCCY